MLDTEAGPAIGHAIRRVLVAARCLATLVVDVDHARLLMRRAELGLLPRESCVAMEHT